jgi:hypothetical protein
MITAVWLKWKNEQRQTQQRHQFFWCQGPCNTLGKSSKDMHAVHVWDDFLQLGQLLHTHRFGNLQICHLVAAGQVGCPGLSCTLL